MAPTATEYRSLRALQRYSEPGRAVARSVLMSIAAPGSFEGRPVMCFASADVTFMTFRCTPGTPTPSKKGNL